MVPNCKGCKYEYQEAIDFINRGFNVVFNNFGKGAKGKHLMIAVIDKNGKIIIS